MASSAAGGMPQAIEKQHIRYVGEEAMILSQLMQTGAYANLETTPILAFYEYVFTIDDFTGHCMSLSEKCVRHLLAVRRPEVVPGSVRVEKTTDGRLLPQPMSTEEIDKHKTQVPPPDFCLWEFRDKMAAYGRQRYADDDKKKLDKLAGMESVMSRETGSDITYVDDPLTYGDQFSAHIRDRALGPALYTRYQTYTPDENPRPPNQARLEPAMIAKTPYQMAIDEAVRCSFDYYNIYQALTQGLYRVHVMKNARKLQAPTTELTWYQQALLQLIYNFRKNSKGPLTFLEEKVNGVDPNLAGVAPLKTAVEQVPIVSAEAIGSGDWINAFANPIVSGVLHTGVGFLQPKPVQWADYGSNYIRKVWSNWTAGGDAPESMRRREHIQRLPLRGGAIAERFAVFTGQPIIKCMPGPDTNLWYTDKPQSIGRIKEKANGPYGTSLHVYTNRDAAKTAIDAARTQWTLNPITKITRLWSGYAKSLEDQFKQVTTGGDVPRHDIVGACCPWPNGHPTADVDKKFMEETMTTLGSMTKETTSLTDMVDTQAAGGGGLDIVLHRRARYVAIPVERETIWQLAEKLTEHPIQYIAPLGRAAAKVKLDGWLRRHYLFPLMRIFNEVVTDRTTAELRCPVDSQVWPVMLNAQGQASAVPLSQAGHIDPTSMQMVFNPAVSQGLSRCVLPGAPQPPAVPGMGNVI
jgi:hypothetical protein